MEQRICIVAAWLMTKNAEWCGRCGVLQNYKPKNTKTSKLQIKNNKKNNDLDEASTVDRKKQIAIFKKSSAPSSS